MGSARSNSSRILLPAEVLRPEQLLQAHDLRRRVRAASRMLPERLVEVLARVGGARHLHQSDSKFRIAHDGIV